MAGIFVPIVADATRLLAAFRKSSEAADQLGRDLNELGLSAEKSAQKQVEAATRRDARLRAEVAAYRQIASAAEKGSREQVAAANLAAQAEQRLSRSLAVTAGESRKYASSAQAADRRLAQFSRGALAGSGIAKALGRSLAFASGGFLAVATASHLLRQSIEAATEAAAVERQLAAQFQVAGKNLDDYRERIDSTALATSKLAGFTKDQLLQSFTTAFRVTQNVSQSLVIMQAASNAARGAHRDLGAVTLGLVRAYGGMATSLRRIGILLPDNIKGMDAVQFVLRKFAGQAIAGTTAQQRFAAALHNTQITVGTELLPEVTRILNATTDWMSKEKNQQRVQRDVNETLKAAKGIIEGVRTVLAPLIELFRALGKVVGGTENEMKLLVGMFALFKLRTDAIKWGVIEGGVAGIGDAAAISTGKVGKLRTVLAGLADLKIGIPVVLSLYILQTQQYKDSQHTVMDWLGHLGFLVKNLPQIIDDEIKRGTKILRGLGLMAQPKGKTARQIFDEFPGKEIAPFFDETSGLPKYVTGQTTFPFTLTAAQKRAMALEKDPENRAALAAQAAYDRKALAFLEGERRRGKINQKNYLDQYKALWADLNDMEDRIKAIDDEAARKAAAAERAAKARAAKAAREAKRRAREAAKAALAAQEALGERVQMPLKLAIAGGLELGVDTAAIQKQTDKTVATLKKQAQTLVSAIKKIQAAYAAAVKSARDEIGALFQGPVLNFSDEQRKAALGIPNSAADPKALLRDLQAQLRAARTFEANLAKLRARGAPAALISELRGQGLGAAPEVAALAGAGRGTLGQFIKAFGQREKLATSIAKAEMRAQLVTLRADKVELASIRRAERFIERGAPTIQVYIDGVEQRGAKVKVKTSAAQRRGPVPGQRALP